VLVAGLSFHTNSVAIVLCHTESEISVAALRWSCTVHYWHWFSDTCWRAHCTQYSAAWFV